MVYTAAHLWDGARLHNNSMIVVEDGRIAALGERSASELPPGANIRNFPDGILAPAFFDVHIHGAAGHDVMEGTPQALSRMGEFLAARGTGAFLATTVSAPVDATLKSLEGLARIIAQTRSKARPSQSGSTWKGRSSRMASGERIRQTGCWLRTLGSSTACSRPPREMCG